MKCGDCKHRDTERSNLKHLGYGLCTLEVGLNAVARNFSEFALCNKNKFTPKQRPKKEPTP